MHVKLISSQIKMICLITNMSHSVMLRTLPTKNMAILNGGGGGVIL